MTKKRSLGVASAFLLSLPLIFSNLAYAQTQIDKNSKKNIESIDSLLERKDTKNINESKKKESKNSLWLGEYYFSPKTKGLKGGLYSELVYEHKINKRLACQLAGGYMGLTAKDEDRTKKETLHVIPVHAGLKYNLFGPLCIKGGISGFNSYLSTMLPFERGGYIGFEINSKIGKNIDFSIEARRQFADLTVQEPHVKKEHIVLEDGSNLTGFLVGGKVNVRF